jgi:hypothetical protein
MMSMLLLSIDKMMTRRLFVRNVVVSEQSVFVAFSRKGDAPRIRRANFLSRKFITQSREAAKKKIRKLSFSFLLRLCGFA